MKKTVKESGRHKKRTPIFPPALQKGDTIGLVAPAGPLIDKGKFSAGVHILEKKGFRLKYNRRLLNVRGYLAGSGWKEYQQTGSICGIPLQAGLQESSLIGEPIFTPATKAELGEHDENITFEKMKEMIGEELAEQARKVSLALYKKGSEMAREKGIIICDTKFEFGLVNGELILIDEVLTPDSSRFWPENEYEPGRAQNSFDKQFVRDYLLTLTWDKNPPAPHLPEEIVQKTSERYLEAFRRLTGRELNLA